MFFCVRSTNNIINATLYMILVGGHRIPAHRFHCCPRGRSYPGIPSVIVDLVVLGGASVTERHSSLNKRDYLPALVRRLLVIVAASKHMTWWQGQSIWYPKYIEWFIDDVANCDPTCSNDTTVVLEMQVSRCSDDRQQRAHMQIKLLGYSREGRLRHNCPSR